MNTILREDAMRIIDTGETFTIGFVTADRRRGTGGEYIVMENMRKITAESLSRAKPGQLKNVSQSIMAELAEPEKKYRKDFNIHNPHKPLQHITKVHYRLFTMFNHKPVIK